MDTYNKLVICCGVLLLVVLGIVWARNRTIISTKYIEIPEQVRMTMVSLTPVEFSRKNILEYCKVNWLRLIIVDAVVLGLIMFGSLADYIKGESVSIGEDICFALVMVMFVSVVALAIDLKRFVLMWMKRGNLYTQLAYVHSVLQGNMVISYYNFRDSRFETKQKHFSEEDIMESGLYQGDNSLVGIIVSAKGQKVRCIALSKFKNKKNN